VEPVDVREQRAQTLGLILVARHVRENVHLTPPKRQNDRLPVPAREAPVAFEMTRPLKVQDIAEPHLRESAGTKGK
jgi:hypothetical protein